MPIPAVGAIPTPTQFLVVSAQGLVQLTWNKSVLATTYYISRSTDNITFAQLAQTASLVYNDSTAVIGTIYYYILQAATVSFSSPATPSQSGQALNPGQTTVGNVRLQAQQRCDRVNSNFITTQEWNSYINQSFKELYDILIQKFGDDYFVATPFTYTTAPNTQFYPLPTNFYKGLGVEVALNPSDPNSWVTLRKFEFIQRNLWNFPNVYTFYGITNLRYRFEGNSIYLVPIPSSGQTIRVWYAPRPDQLINDTDTLDMISGWEEYIISDICIKAMAKEESDVSVFAAQKQALIKRIEEAAENRDLGEPETVSDSKLRNFAWSDDNWSGGNRW